MSSTIEPLPSDVHARFPWWDDGLVYYAYGYHLRRLYGYKVWRISIDGGFTCPNVDGSVAIGGCTFCDNRSFSPSRRVRRSDVETQIARGIEGLRRRYGETVGPFVAYFQPGTNTYGPIEKLTELFTAAVEHPQIVGLAIGTRPDCVPDDVLDLLQRLAGHLPVSVEYGMQTMHDRSLTEMNRGHGHACLVDAMERSRGRGFEIGLHLLIGWPGETRADVLASAEEVARLGADSVKLHSLYAVDGTPFGEQVKSGEVELMSMEDYIQWAADVLERLPERTVIERLSAHAPPEYLIGPSWCLESAVVRREIEAELRRRGTRQGSRCPETGST